MTFCFRRETGSGGGKQLACHIALVVGHGNTISNIVKALGITAAVTIPDNDYNELFLVTLNDKCQLVGLHYAF